VAQAVPAGDDKASLESLSITTGAPSLAQLKRRSSAENWLALRAELRAQSDTKIQEIDADLKAEVRGRHAKVSQSLITLGMDGLASLGLDRCGRNETDQHISVYGVILANITPVCLPMKSYPQAPAQACG